MKLNFVLGFSLLDWGAFQLRQGWLSEAEITLDEAVDMSNDLHHLKVTAQAKLATIYLAQGKSQEALTLVNNVWQAIEPTGGKGLPFPINTMYECYSIFQAGDDVRADAAIKMAADVLKRTTAGIDDLEMRAAFLNNVPVNQLVRAVFHEDPVETGGQ